MKRFDVLPGIRRVLRLPPRTTSALHAEIDEELAALVDARVEALMARGMSYDDARHEAAQRLGDTIDRVRDRLHTSAGLRERRMRFNDFVDDLRHDLRYAARGLVRRPTFTTLAVATLAIGIGATTTMFSAVNVLLVRPLPYDNPDQLMKVSLTIPADAGRPARDDMSWSYPKFAAFRDAQDVFSGLSLYTPTQITLTSGDVELVRGEEVTAPYLRTIGITPIRGVDFDPAEHRAGGAPRQVVISTGLWERRFNANPNIVGTTLDINRTPYTIIGITPGGFRGLTGRAELFTPITSRSAAELSEIDSHEFYAVGRRKPDVSLAQAVSAVDVLGKRIRDTFASSRMGSGSWGAKTRPLNDARVSPLVRQSALVLFGAVGFVLLIACANVANLLLGRANTRRREIAVRLALGAARARLVRLLLTESMLLALLGGAASVGVAWLGTRGLAAIEPAAMIRAAGLAGLGVVSFSSIALDWTALSFTFGLALTVGVVFGLAPALGATRAALSHALKDDRGGRHRSGRNTLVIAEVALAVVLLAGSGLMIRSLANLLAIDTGIDARNVLTLRLTVPPGSLSRDSMPDFYAQLLDRVGAVPGVASASLANCAPLSGGCASTRLERLDRPRDLASAPSVVVDWVTPAWFPTMRVPLKHGRLFSSADRLGAPRVVVINEAAARAIFPDENPIGKRVAVGQGGFGDGAEVVGVVGDVRQSVESPAQPDVYLPYAQSPRPGMIVFVRTLVDPSAIANDVRRAIHDVAPRYPIYDAQLMITRAAAATAQTRFNAVLLGLFATTALLLAVVGIYGVISLSVASRTRELGIRFALGADQRRVRTLVVREGLVLVAVGSAIGLAAALVSTRALQSLLYDLRPTDPVTYVGIFALLAAAGTAASWIPARRASRVDPVVALRTDA